MWLPTMTRPDIANAVRTMGKFCRTCLERRTRESLTADSHTTGTRRWHSPTRPTLPARTPSGRYAGGKLSWGGRDQLAFAHPEDYVVKYLGVGVRIVVGGCEGSAFSWPGADVHDADDPGYPIVTKEDNEGAIQMAKNKHSSRRTRDKDINYHVVSKGWRLERSISNTRKQKTNTRTYSREKPVCQTREWYHKLCVNIVVRKGNE